MKNLLRPLFKMKSRISYLSDEISEMGFYVMYNELCYFVSCWAFLFTCTWVVSGCHANLRTCLTCKLLKRSTATTRQWLSYIFNQKNVFYYVHLTVEKKPTVCSVSTRTVTPCRIKVKQLERVV